MGGVNATLGNGHEIQGQNYVTRLQGRVLWVWPHYRNFILGIWYFTLISLTCLSGLMSSKANSRFGDPWSFSGRGNFSIFDIVNPLWCWLLRLNPGVRGEHLTRQLSWVAGWLLVTCFSPVYLIKEGCYIGGVYLSLEIGGRWDGKGGRVVSWEGGKGV